MLKKTFIIIVGALLGVVSLDAAFVADSQFRFKRRVTIPEFLPNDYKPFFEAGDLVLDSRVSTNEMEVVSFSSKDESLRLTLSYRAYDQSHQAEFWENFIAELSQTISTNSGCFLKISENEVEAEVFEEETHHRIFTFLLPSSIHIWDFEISSDEQTLFKQLHFMVNQQRYRKALLFGERFLIHWKESVYQHVDDLLESGRNEDALAVLSKYIQVAPQDCEAHARFFPITNDSDAALCSARIVYNNAENQEQVDKAARFLGETVLSIDTLKPLLMGERGLQLILLPIPPCNPWVLESSAAVFEEITGIPATVYRLETSWEWGDFDRVSHELDARDLILQSSDGYSADFSTWSQERYVEELKKIAESKDPLSQYPIQVLIKQIQECSGQYRMAPYLEQLGSILAEVRSSDPLTMYVGVTGTNLYSGDDQFAFSEVAGNGKASSVALLSYYMMQGLNNAEAPSRSRLSGRIGKELVSAALMQLGIRRSIDSKCPYSYATGIERLDQKTKELSPLVKRAILELQQTPSLKLK